MHLLGLQNKFLESDNRMLIAATKNNKKPALGTYFSTKFTKLST